MRLHIPFKYSLIILTCKASCWELSESCLLFPGFIISGGYPYDSLQKVEIFNPSSGNSCPVQDLHVSRHSHTSCSGRGLICGGYYNEPSSLRSCEKITGTEVSLLPSLRLTRERRGHLCWRLPNNKIMFIGGGASPTTTEIVSGSSSSRSFYLPYGTE